jgi:hypothetical protein
MGGIGVLLILLVHRIPWQALFPDNLQDWAVQLGIGIVYGWLSSMLMLLLLRRRVMDAARTVFSNLMLRFKMRTIDIVFISLCADRGMGHRLCIHCLARLPRFKRPTRSGIRIIHGGGVCGFRLFDAFFWHSYCYYCAFRNRYSADEIPEKTHLYRPK